MGTSAKDRVLGLFKFGKRPHIDAFVAGNLYMNPLSYFTELEGDEVRGDREDMIRWSHQATQLALSMEVDGNFVPINNLVGQVRFSHPGDRRANVFCMYAFRDSRAETLVDPRNFAFGDTYAILVNGDEFLRRVLAAAREQELAVTWSLVGYVPRESHTGPMGIFCKFDTFQYQSEFRIALLPGTGEPYTLSIGDLRDIVLTGPLEQLNSRLRIDATEAP
jgi:hypothetical protein